MPEKNSRVMIGAALLLLAAGSALLSSCGEKQGANSVMTDSIYVEVMFELINARNRPGTDTAENALRRQQSLEKHKVTAEQIENKSLVLAENPALLAEVWGKIRVKLGGAP